MDSPAPTCPQCGFENPPRMRFCGNCGVALAVTRAAEERKIVTVLFADVVGSTKLSGTIDPERMHDMMTRLFAIAREEIERFGGTVEKFIGDAVMAVFGLPAIHEDDPERAVRAAAAIGARVRLEVEAGSLPAIRIGVNTGEVVANPQAHEKGEFLLTGEMVNLAARLQQHAEPGQILVAERTMQAVSQIANLEPIASLTVKGAAAPVPVWSLLGVHPPTPRELRMTHFVGREEELALLQGHLRRMLRENRGHVVTILGAAGVGKTRLAREFRTRTEHVHTMSGRAVPYGTGVPFWALGEAIREECGILFDDPLEDARKKVQNAAARFEIADAAPALLAVLGMAGERVDLTREVLFSGMRAFFQALAHRSPLLLILEDIHLAEDVTLDFLDQAADWVRDIPILLLGLARPELLDRRTAWMGGKRSATTLVLDPLGTDESRELAAAILGLMPGPDPLVRAVMERAEGNPLFMEEILRTLIDRKILVERSEAWELAVPMAQVTIPDTVHAVVAARVDALPAREKQILQDAALQGKDFYRGGLLVVAEGNHIDEAVRALTAKELIMAKRRSTLAGEDEFAFRHILIRDVAYTSIPKSQRWPKHARVAAWMEKVIGDRRAEFADFIAYHWLQVIALRRELGLPSDREAHARAIDNLLIAGDRSAAVYANTTALDHYSRALELDPPPDLRMRVLMSQGEVWMLLGRYERARESFQAVRQSATSLNQPRWEAVALDHLGHTFRRQDQIAQALAHLEPALALSRRIGDSPLTARILNHIGFTYFSDGRHVEAIRAHDEARQIFETSRDLTGLAESLHGLGENLFFQGKFVDSIPWLAESMKICTEAGDRSLAAENQYMIGMARHMLGEYAKGYPEVQQSAATLAEIGDVWNYSVVLWNLAHHATTFGHFGEAVDLATRGLSLARQIEAIRFTVYNLITLGILHRELEDVHGAWQVDREAADLAQGVGGAFLPWVLASLALDATELGRTQEADEHLRRARHALEQTQTRMIFHQEVNYAEGRLLLASGRPGDALQAAQRLLNIVASTNTLHYRVPALLLKGDAKAAMGEHSGALESYLAAAQDAEQQGRPPALWRAHLGAAQIQRALGFVEQSIVSAKRAREIVERLAMTVPDERLRATFLQSPPVQRVTALTGS